jgi:2-methylcitrate dehydratase PrpD
MTDDETLGRRTFLQMATVAGTAHLSPALAGAAGAAIAPAEAESGHAGGERSWRKEETAHETIRLAEYAAAVRYEDLPGPVIQRAKDCIADTVATIIYGADLPWSRMILAYAQRNGGGGNSRVLGAGDTKVHAPAAALAHGAFAHAFELDNLTQPNSGAHPGATLLSSALAVAQERGLGGRELVTAFVAGAEVMIRIGQATKHTNEERGFHAPGTTGPFGAAVAVGRLLQFDAAKMANALGIAGSLACGLLEFARSGTGAMVKRLHLGRAAESGVLAASLAADGFTGPASVIEGEFGFLKVFCRDWDLGALTGGLGESYVTMSILMKRFACHITAHTPVEAILDLRDEHKFTPGDVASIAIVGNDRQAKVNNIPRPVDRMMAQYSVPFCVALALYRDPRDPRAFDEAAVHDPDILDLTSRIMVTPASPPQDRGNLATTVTVALKDGRAVSRRVAEFKGTPARPLDRQELREKFLLLTRHVARDKTERMFDRLQQIENETSLDWLSV